MKNIEILMQDKFYANNLNTTLNNMFDDINSKSINDLDKKIDRSLLITDLEEFKNNQNYLYLNEERKYKNIDYIYKLIIEKYKEIEQNLEKQAIISFINLSELKPINPEATEFARYYSKDYDTLLLNLNIFSEYKKDEKEITLDSLLFIRDKKSDISVNKIDDISYISSSNMPFETEKFEYIGYILEILKYQKYKKIVIDLSFNITSRNIEILKNSDIIIFFNNEMNEKKFINSSKTFIKNQLNHNYQVINMKKNQENYELEINGQLFYLENMGEVVKTYDEFN